MKAILLILCTFILSSVQALATDSTLKDKEILLLAATYPELTLELARAYPHLGNEIKNSAEKKHQDQLRTELAKKISWDNFSCQELNTGQEYLISETRSPQPIGCASKMVTENSDNPATVNSAQNEANGVASSLQQGLITEEEAQLLINEITANGSQIEDPLPASGS